MWWFNTALTVILPLVDFLSIRYPFAIKEMTIFIILYFWKQSFSSFSKVVPTHWTLQHLISRSKVKHQLSFPVIIFLWEFGPVPNISNKSAQEMTYMLHDSVVRQCGINHMQIFLFCKSFFKSCYAIVLVIPTSYSVILHIIRWSATSRFLATSVLASVHVYIDYIII